jgi:hypothetical protein
MVFVTAYLVGVIVVLGIWGIIAYKKQAERGEIDDN